MRQAPGWCPASGRVAVIALVLVAVSATAQEPAARDQKVIVLLSGDAEPYRAALAGFRETLGRQAPTVSVEVVGAGGAQEIRRAVSSAGASVVVLALGTAATREAAAAIEGTPLVAGMILNPRELEGYRNATGVYLEHPADTEIEWLTQLLPGQRRVGIIYHSEESANRVEQTRRAAAGSNLSIQAIRVETAADIPVALDALSNRTDVILGLTDPLVFNAETVRPLLMFSFKNRIPIVGPSSGWVRAGAIYALDRDYTDVGVQCAELTLRILGGQRPASLPPQPPRKVGYSINQRTATELRIEIPQALLRSAQEVVR